MFDMWNMHVPLRTWDFEKNPCQHAGKFSMLFKTRTCMFKFLNIHVTNVNMHIMYATDVNMHMRIFSKHACSKNISEKIDMKFLHVMSIFSEHEFSEKMA